MSGRHRKWASVCSIFFALIVASGNAAASETTPAETGKTEAALARCDECHSLVEVGPRLFIEDPQKAPATLALLARSRQDLEKVFGALKSNPTYLVCFSDACTRRLGFDAGEIAGRSFGSVRIEIGPRGTNLETFLHEGVHAEVDARTRRKGEADTPFPYWFDEGIAEYVSGGASPFHQGSDVGWVSSLVGREHWIAAHSKVETNSIYGAAGEAVRRIGDVIGWQGVVRIVDRVGGGESFDAAFEAEMERSRPR